MKENKRIAKEVLESIKKLEAIPEIAKKDASTQTELVTRSIGVQTDAIKTKGRITKEKEEVEIKKENKLEESVETYTELNPIVGFTKF